MNYLDELENTSIRILREAYANFKSLGMLWSMGKDSTVLLWLVRKAFFGHVPFPLIHIDTKFKIPEMITYRDQLVRELHLPMIVGVNEEALAARNTFPDGKVNRILLPAAQDHRPDGYHQRHRRALPLQPCQ